MTKKIFLIPALCLAFAFSACNNQDKTKSTAENTKAAKDSSAKDACLVPISAADSAKYISKQLEVKGEVENTLTLTVDSLKQMKAVIIDNFKLVCMNGATMKDIKSCKGVLLKDILEKAKIKQANHKDHNFYIVARATDNFKATFSWAELFNNATGNNTYVLFEENGQPITSQGNFILVCTNDIVTGMRHVFWLKSIEVNRVN